MKRRRPAKKREKKKRQRGGLVRGIGLKDLAQRPAVERALVGEQVVKHLSVAAGMVGVPRVALDGISVRARTHSCDDHGVPGDHLGPKHLFAAALKAGVKDELVHDLGRRKVQVPDVVNGAVLGVVGDDPGAPRTAEWQPAERGPLRGNRVPHCGILTAVGSQVLDRHHQSVELVQHLNSLEQKDIAARRSKKKKQMNAMYING